MEKLRDRILDSSANCQPQEIFLLQDESGPTGEIGPTGSTFSPHMMLAAKNGESNYTFQSYRRIDSWDSFDSTIGYIFSLQDGTFQVPEPGIYRLDVSVPIQIESGYSRRPILTLVNLRTVNVDDPTDDVVEGEIASVNLSVSSSPQYSEAVMIGIFALEPGNTYGFAFQVDPEGDFSLRVAGREDRVTTRLNLFYLAPEI